jgi:uncharacterized protein YecE (DUF72 family)
MRRLRDVQIPTANFFVSGILCLREKPGPILSQFPPTFLWIEEKFRTFSNWRPAILAPRGKRRGLAAATAP